MKKLVAVVAVLVLAFVLAGCGGGGEATTAGTTDTASGTPAGSGTSTATALPPRPEVPYALDPDKPETPAFFREELKKKEPVLLAFYADDPTSEALIQEIQTAYGNYEGVVAVMLLRIGDNDEIARLADQFRIGYVPYVAVINRGGSVIYEKHGYVDSKVIEQALYNAVNR